MKIFAVADVHGHYTEMKQALDKEGFEENNPDHLLVTIGDMFDRGEESEKIFKYIYELNAKGKAVCLKGNHTDFLLDYLTGKSITPFNFIFNGTNKTIDDFLHRTDSFYSWCLIDKDIKEPTYGNFADFIREARKEINEEYPLLRGFLETRPYYFETKNYIFTHSGIDTSIGDWHKPKRIYHHFEGWEACIWNIDFFGEEIKNTDKTIVIGHTHNRELRDKFKHLINEKECNQDDILIRKDKKIIALDACTILSKKVNVLVVEDELYWKNMK